jgi:hypothetical protein
MAFDRAPRWAATLAGLLLATGSARAEPGSGRRELARQLMNRGNQLRAVQDFKGALDAFLAADEIMHVPTTGFEVARSEVQLGQLVEAHDLLMRVERISEQPNEPQAFKEARAYAHLLEVDIAPRIPKIRLRVPSDVAVTVDGESVPVAAFDIPYTVDPGKHVVVASAADGRTATQEVLVDEGAECDVVLALPPPSPPSPPPRTAPTATARPAPSSRRPLAWVAFGTAGAAVLVGGAAGIASWVRETSASARCNGNQCPPSTYGDIDAARTSASVSTISFVVAGIAAALGVVGVLTAPNEAGKARAPSAHSTTPSVGIGARGFTGTF